MTLENAKRLYDHYIKTGQKENAENIAYTRPEVKEDKTTESKKDGKKSA